MNADIQDYKLFDEEFTIEIPIVNIIKSTRIELYKSMEFLKDLIFKATNKGWTIIESETELMKTYKFLPPSK